ncbi:MAG: hypothetical protein IJQ81_06705 [Oscillibacter sp.]|nr:hypothetical protein [Oscillibacter sp.]
MKAISVILVILFLVAVVFLGAFVYVAAVLWAEKYGNPDDTDDDYFLGRRREDIENDSDK